MDTDHGFLCECPTGFQGEICDLGQLSLDNIGTVQGIERLLFQILNEDNLFIKITPGFPLLLQGNSKVTVKVKVDTAPFQSTMSM